MYIRMIDIIFSKSISSTFVKIFKLQVMVIQWFVIFWKLEKHSCKKNSTTMSAIFFISQEDIYVCFFTF